MDGKASLDPERKADLNQQVRKLFDRFGPQSEKILFEVMPRKVIHLDSLYKRYRGQCPEKPSISTKGAAINSRLLAFMNTLKKEIFELLDFLNTLRMWIQLNIPKISDGNNFGVGVQEEIVAMLKSGRASGMNVLDSTIKYYATRAKLVTKIVKYPRLDDYRKSIEELDSKEWLMLGNCCLDLRNNYATLFDLITKNMDKITRPRGFHDEPKNLY